MNHLEYSFEPSPWENWLRSKQAGDTIYAAELLTLMEGEEEQTVEMVLEELETACVYLDISGLPKAAGSGEFARRLRQEMELAQKDITPEQLEEGDPLRLFLEEVAAIPAQGDEDILSQRCAAGDEGAAAALTNLGLHRVIDLAAAYTGYGVLLLDLIQEGSLGLWQAIRSYHRGDYISHTERWIRFYMAKAVTLQCRSSGVGTKLRTALEDYREVDERLLGELGRNPSLEEIAEQMHMSVAETEIVKKMLDNARLLSQAKKQPEPEEEEEAQDQAVEDTALFQMRQRILDLLSNLDKMDAEILTLRFGLEGGLPLSAEDIAKRLNLTASEVTEREAAALSRLRNR